MPILSETRAAEIANTGVFHSLGSSDSRSTFLFGRSIPPEAAILEGIVDQINIGLYSAKVSSVRGDGTSYVCMLGANFSQGLGYSDIGVINEGDEVIFCPPGAFGSAGIILAVKPSPYACSGSPVITTEEKMDRRSSFSSDDCYRPNSPAWSAPLASKVDTSTIACTGTRPTDIVPGESGFLNPFRCGWLGGMYSMTVCGGAASIRMSALDSRIRMVADSVLKYTMSGNECDWHAGKYLSQEKSVCLYQEERLGCTKGANPFEESDYFKDGYFAKQRVKAQTAVPRIREMQGFGGNLYARYFSRPDPAQNPGNLPWSMDDRRVEPGVARESVDPSGQYRLAATGMIGTERIGRIPVPVRTKMPWANGMDMEDTPPSTLSEFKHSADHPFYRQLELADRVAYDMKNSYARVDEDPGFSVPQEKDISAESGEDHSLKDVYDEDHTSSRTVRLERYDRRRSGIWQGEDGSIILRDAWGSEIVMIGGNIQLSCAGNIQIMPGRTAMTIAGDDIVQKAHKSIDIHAANNDVRIDSARNIQMMAGIDEKHPGGITIESIGKPGIWSNEDVDGGEQLATSGILIKSTDGAVVTEAEKTVIRSYSQTSMVAGNEEIDGTLMLSSKNIYGRGEQVLVTTGAASMLLSDGASCLTGGSVIVAGKGSCSILSGEKVFVPLALVPIDKNVAEEIEGSMQPLVDIMTDDYKVSLGYSKEKLEDMKFVFRSSSECRTETSWEIGGSGDFTLYEPFWIQVSTKFETLDGISTEKFDDHYELWTDDRKKEESRGLPWPGEKAADSAKYAKIDGDFPANLDEHGFNRSRDAVADSTDVTEVMARDGYLVRK